VVGCRVYQRLRGLATEFERSISEITPRVPPSLAGEIDNLARAQILPLYTACKLSLLLLLFMKSHRSNIARVCSLLCYSS
jgi:hypothetical protein